MCSNKSSYSNPIYDIIDETNLSFSQPLMINIEPTCSFPCTNKNSIPLLLLANCLTSPPLTTHHNYVNQRINEIIEDEENLYAKPRKRCITLEDEPIIIPPKTSRFSLKSIKPERAQLVSTTLPVATVLSSIDSSDEIDQFIARENDRVERVKLRRRQNRTTTTIINKQSEKRPPAFSNPNYVEIEILRDTKEEKLPKSILV
ncbi:unnamed protein product [Adineta steineri]|uniref:Uncharacterized protein n=1 Tax=Adineta steineri TaxID=433720 RepID=A0A815BKL4_9BILA|nr:unnamed protein product [Adineta steineri]CAF3765450.1 unnamed protein product [Adineta steineri]